MSQKSYGITGKMTFERITITGVFEVDVISGHYGINGPAEYFLLKFGDHDISAEEVALNLKNEIAVTGKVIMERFGGGARHYRSREILQVGFKIMGNPGKEVK